MFFNTYFDPEAIIIAEKLRITSNLIHLLRDWANNCIVFVFKDDRLGKAIFDNIDKITDPDDKKRIKSLFSLLGKRNRFIYEISPDYENIKSDIQCLVEQIDKLDIDFLLIEKNTLNGINISNNINYSSIEKYTHTIFEDKRSKLANTGMVLRDKEYNYTDFYNKVFLKALKYANSIELWDKLVGEKWGDNFDYNLRKFIGWLGKITVIKQDLKIEIHCGESEGRLKETIIPQLKSFRKDNIENIPIKVYSYKKGKLPHQRYLITDQIALDIGRGIDLVDPKTQLNRDTSFSLKDLKDLKKILSDYSRFKV